ncbi:MAG TPA: hypothetical protein VJ841_03505 [Candidatus Saccharimonadales bacterium]|nr:hypothetical protein [Candidatus Saccharimonadales bacterium]
MEKIIKRRPGFLFGLSTEQAYPDEVVEFFDGKKNKLLELELGEAMPSRNGAPGYEFDEPIFFRERIIMVCPFNVEVIPFYT